MSNFDEFQTYLVRKDHDSSYAPNTDPSKYRISGIPYCNRKAYFIKQGLPNKPSDYLSRLGTEGRLHHEQGQKDAIKMVENHPTKTVIDEESLEIPLRMGGYAIRLRGKIDLKWRDTSDVDVPVVEIVDIKAVGSRAWYGTRREGGFSSHVDQVLVYGMGWRQVHNEKPLLGLWYKNRNDGQWQEVRLLYNKKRIEFLMKKLEELVVACNTEVPPDNYSPMHSFECNSKSSRCSYYNMCYQGDEFLKYNEDEKDESKD